MRIVNIVSLWNYGKPINLMSPMEHFNADVIKNGLPTLLTFSSGKIIATGCKTLGEARQAVREWYPSSKFIRIVNMTGLAYFKSKPKIEKLPGVTYEPELFPAYVWRKGKAVVVYYNSGKLIVTGGKSYKDLLNIFNTFKSLTGIKRASSIIGSH